MNRDGIFNLAINPDEARDLNTLLPVSRYSTVSAINPDDARNSDHIFSTSGCSTASTRNPVFGLIYIATAIREHLK